MNHKNLRFVPVITISIAAILTFFKYYNILPVNETALLFSRWLAIGGLIIYGLKKRSLTAWILISMVIGAEIGHDYPEIGMKLQVLSKVFLKLIKTIVAPLLFATLVYGIAGHSDLKQVGRMGWKSIVYFEVVTTIALFIGLAAINISKAGVGINLPAGVQEELPEVPPQTLNDIILHVFPENIAKSFIPTNSKS